MAQRYPVSAIRDAWYVYGLDAGRFDVVHRIINTGHTTWAAVRADLNPTAQAAYDNIVQRRARATNMPHAPKWRTAPRTGPLARFRCL